jgi:hypothetical protein
MNHTSPVIPLSDTDSKPARKSRTRQRPIDPNLFNEWDSYDPTIATDQNDNLFLESLGRLCDR